LESRGPAEKKMPLPSSGKKQTKKKGTGVELWTSRRDQLGRSSKGIKKGSGGGLAPTVRGKVGKGADNEFGSEGKQRRGGQKAGRGKKQIKTWGPLTPGKNGTGLRTMKVKKGFHSNRGKKTGFEKKKPYVPAVGKKPGKAGAGPGVIRNGWPGTGCSRPEKAA